MPQSPTEHVAPPPHLALKQPARAWFETLRDRLCAEFEAIEDAQDGPLAELSRRPVQPDGMAAADRGRVGRRRRRDERDARAGVREGGGERLHRLGRVQPRVPRQIPGAEQDPRFWASGISLVAHMQSPRVPAAHFNTRLLITTKGWFGGGGDLTPMRLDAPEAIADAADFHAAFKAACDRHDAGYYPEFKAWCDRYFFLPHRGEPRGAGGIFFDHHFSGDADADFAFTRDVGSAFLDVFPRIVRRRMREPWTAEEREHQLVRRGRYVEFNLIHDRGTLFGLKTGGNVEAILMSLPPEVKWP